jgi:hypothetical protein
MPWSWDAAADVPAVTRAAVRTTVPRGVPVKSCDTQVNDCEAPAASEKAGQKTRPPGAQALELFVQLGRGVLEARGTWASFTGSTVSATEELRREPA